MGGLCTTVVRQTEAKCLETVSHMQIPEGIIDNWSIVVIDDHATKNYLVNRQSGWSMDAMFVD